MNIRLPNGLWRLHGSCFMTMCGNIAYSDAMRRRIEVLPTRCGRVEKEIGTGSSVRIRDSAITDTMASVAEPVDVDDMKAIEKNWRRTEERNRNGGSESVDKLPMKVPQGSVAVCHVRFENDLQRTKTMDFS